MTRRPAANAYQRWLWIAILTASGCNSPDGGGTSAAPGTVPAGIEQSVRQDPDDVRPVEIVPERARGAAPDAGTPSQAAAAAPEVGRTFVFDCDDLSFTVRTGAGEVALWMPATLGGRYLVLSLTQTASGARYEEGDTAFWSKGDLATFEVAGRTYLDCRSNPRKVPWADAARRGVVFRALGNEPSWNLEIDKDRLVLFTDFGATRSETPYAAVPAGAKTTYRGSGETQLVAVVERRACSDSMSGEAFEAAATVTFEDKILYGCGRFL
jgi:putative lipoprotein